MIPRREFPDPFDDIEKPHPVVAESVTGGPREPLTVRLSGLWTDLMHVDDGTTDTDSRLRAHSPMPLLDYMKGIMQWD